MESLRADLRLRGFGWLAPDRIARRLEPLAARRTAFWDEVLRTRPPEAPPPARVLQVRPRFRWKYAGMAAAAIFFLIGVSSWLPRGFLRASYNAYWVKATRDLLDLPDLAEYKGTCSERPVEAWARLAATDSAFIEVQPPKAEMALDCLARLRPPGAARAVFESFRATPEYPRHHAGRRVALVLALGEPAVEDACQAAFDASSPSAQIVALRSLALLDTSRSSQCFLEATFHGDPAVRAAAAANLGVLALGQRVSAGKALDAAIRLSRDSDAAVRAAIATSLVLFDERNARKALLPLARDSDPAVRKAAEESLQSLDGLRKVEELQQLGR
jgi:hypothetical protein